ncbi:MAG: choice-of-anchor V domain-containing protein [Polyangiaceae bacterium]
MKRSAFTFALLLASVGLVHEARANAPALPGYTGLPNAMGVSSGCNNCHNGGTPPTLNLTGPATIQAGVPASYTLMVNTGSPRGQGMVAIPNGSGTITAVSGLEKPFASNQELTASGTNTKTYQFTITGASAGSFTLYYAGLAASGNGTGGDGYARQTMNITVTGGGGGTDAGRPDSGTNPGTDSGLPPIPDGGVVTPLPDGGTGVTFPDGAVTPLPSGNGNGNGSGNGNGNGSGGTLDGGDDGGGCNTSGGSLSLSGVFAAGAVAAFLVGSRRIARRRRGA